MYMICMDAYIEWFGNWSTATGWSRVTGME